MEVATATLIEQMHAEYAQVIPMTAESMAEKWAAVFIRAGVPPMRLLESYEKATDLKRRKDFGKWMPTVHEVVSAWEAIAENDLHEAKKRETQQFLQEEEKGRETAKNRKVEPNSAADLFRKKFVEGKKRVTA